VTLASADLQGLGSRSLRAGLVTEHPHKNFSPTVRGLHVTPSVQVDVPRIKLLKTCLLVEQTAFCQTRKWDNLRVNVSQKQNITYPLALD